MLATPCNTCDTASNWTPNRPGIPSRPPTPAPSRRQVGGDHYLGMGVQPWDVVDTWPREQRIGFYRGNAIKYLMRMGSKDTDRQEARKAQHYLEQLIQALNEWGDDV